MQREVGFGMDQHSDEFDQYAPGCDGAPQRGDAGYGEPPSSPGYTPSPIQDILGAPPFSIGNAFSLGWSGFKARYGLLLGASALYLLIYFAAEIVFSVTAIFTLLPLASWAAGFLLHPVLGLGLVVIALHAVRGRHTEIGDLFVGFKRYWPVVGTNALVTLIVWGVTLVPIAVFAFVLGLLLPALGGTGGTGGSAQFGVIAMVVLGVVVVLVPILLIYPRVLLAPMICLDTEIKTVGVTDAISLSWKMTGEKGVRGGIIGVGFLLVMIFVACFVLLILPVVFFAMPLGIAVYAALYWQVSRGYWARRMHTCLRCGYDLRYSPGGRCPECGAAISEQQQDEIAMMV
jgi:hypothetical protein